MHCTTWWGTALVIASILGCDSTTPDPKAALHRAQAQWAAAGITHYQLQLVPECFCSITGTRVVAEVMNGAVVSLRYADSLQVNADTTLYALFTTVPRLFALIDDAITSHAARVDVLYTPRIGVPAAIDIDYDLALADDELTVTLESFSQLP